MKNILLLILVAWSTISFSQNEKSIAFKPVASSGFLGHLRPAIDELETTRLNVGYEFGNQVSGYQELIAPPIQRYDSIVFWKWDTIIYDWKLNSRQVDFDVRPDNKILSYKTQLWDGMTWKDNFQYSNEYDTSGNLIYAETMRWSGVTWNNYSSTAYTYNDSNKIERILFSGWNGTAWINTEQRNYLYDDRNNQVIFNSQYWSGNTWNNSIQYLSTFDNDNNEVTLTLQDGDGNLWVNSVFLTSRYDTRGNLIFDSIQVWEVDAWVNSALNLSEFSPTNKRLSQHYQSWVNGEWVESQFVTYSYNGIDSLENMLVEVWSNDDWVVYRERVFTYDENNDLVKTNTNLWSANEWIPLNVRRYTYDDNHFQKSSSLLRFNADGTTFVSGDSTHYHFSILSATDNPAKADNSLEVYPNPSRGKFTIDHVNAEAIEIFSVSGKRVYAATMEKDQVSFQIDLGQSAPGLYFIRLQEGRQTYCHKIVVQ